MVEYSDQSNHWYIGDYQSNSGSTYKIIDNFLSEDVFLHIKSELTSILLPWQWDDKITFEDEECSDGYFAAGFYNGTILHPAFQIITPLLDKIDPTLNDYESIICNPINVSGAKKIKMIKRGWRNLIKDPAIFLSSNKTSFAWSLTLTFDQILCILPFEFIKKVVLTIPINFLPKKDFLPQTPYFFIIDNFSSDNKSNFILYFFLNFKWLLILSLETP